MAGWRVGFVVGNAAVVGALGATEVVARLRHVPADPDRRDRGDERAARLSTPGVGDLPVPPRRAVRRPRPRRLVVPEAEGDDVRVGADPRAVRVARVARVRREARARGERGRLARASASAPTGTDSSGSRSSRTSSGSASRRCGGSGRLAQAGGWQEVEPRVPARRTERAGRSASFRTCAVGRGSQGTVGSRLQDPRAARQQASSEGRERYALQSFPSLRGRPRRRLEHQSSRTGENTSSTTESSIASTGRGISLGMNTLSPAETRLLVAADDEPQPAREHVGDLLVRWSWRGTAAPVARRKGRRDRHRLAVLEELPADERLNSSIGHLCQLNRRRRPVYMGRAR